MVGVSVESDLATENILLPKKTFAFKKQQMVEHSSYGIVHLYTLNIRRFTETGDPKFAALDIKKWSFNSYSILKGMVH